MCCRSHEREAFDVIAFKSILGGIGANDHVERQRDAIERLHAALKPGGNLLFAENVAATRIHAAVRARFGAGKDGWRYPTMRELSALLRPFASVHGRTAGFLGTWGIERSAAARERRGRRVPVPVARARLVAIRDDGRRHQMSANTAGAEPW